MLFRSIANPTSLILSAAMLLDWRARRCADPKLATAATLVERAVDKVLESPHTRTRDIGGSLDTDAFAAAVIGVLRQSKELLDVKF